MSVDAPQPVPPSEPTVTAVVLAGGASRRMGRDKALLEVDGRRLVDLQVDRLREAGVESLRIAIGDRGLPAWPLPEGTVAVPDPGPDLGPIGGILGAFRSLRTDWLAVVAVDLPGLRVAWLRRLLSLRTPGVGVVPETEGRLEPLAALYPAAAAASLERRRGEGRLGVQEWVREGLRAGWMRTWSLTPSEAEPLANWNRPEDWRP